MDYAKSRHDTPEGNTAPARTTLLRFATEIKEMDINPLLATEKYVIAVDARIRIEKNWLYVKSRVVVQYFVGIGVYRI